MSNGLIISFLILFVFIILAMTVSILTTVIFSPTIYTPKEILSEILKIIKPEDGDLVYDLGSGDGRVLIAMYKYASIKGVGIDISPIAVLFSKIVRFVNLGIKHDIEFDSNNIFDLKIKDANIIYVYQNEKILGILEKKFKKELDNTKVYTYKHGLKDKKAYRKHFLSNGETLFEYRY